MRNIFAGYIPLNASPSDPIHAKWNSVRRGLPDHLELQPPKLSLTDISQMNAAVNSRVRYRTDQLDTWQTPSETLTLGTGDCEDYAILKYALLLRAGLTEQHLCIVLGEIKNSVRNRHHAILVANIDNQRRVLDNLFDHLIEPNAYFNWNPIKGITGSNLFLFSRGFTLKSLASR